MKRCLSLVLCIVVLFCGCREGGYENADGLSVSTSAAAEELNIGVRTEYSSFSSSKPHKSTSSSSESSTATVSSSSSTTTSSTSTAASGSTSKPPASTASYSEAPVSSAPPVSEVIGASTGSEVSDGDPTGGEVTGEASVGWENSGETPPDDDTPAAPGEGTESTSDEPKYEETVSPYDYEGTVYVASSGNGTKYHKSPTCSNMKGVNGMTVDEALTKGFTPCKKCW